MGDYSAPLDHESNRNLDVALDLFEVRRANLQKLNEQ